MEVEVSDEETQETENVQQPDVPIVSTETKNEDNGVNSQVGNDFWIYYSHCFSQ